MSGEHIDYGIERQRHEGFVGRAALLARLDQLLVADRIDRWVVVTGGPGMGKSAMLAAWLAQREATGALGVHDAEADVARTTERCRAGGDEALCWRFEDLARVLIRESHWLREAPEATAALVWNRLRRSGWGTDDLDKQLRIPGWTARRLGIS